jgi:hypothetical protein
MTISLKYALHPSSAGKAQTIVTLGSLFSGADFLRIG